MFVGRLEGYNQVFPLEMPEIWIVAVTNQSLLRRFRVKINC